MTPQQITLAEVRGYVGFAALWIIGTIATAIFGGFIGFQLIMLMLAVLGLAFVTFMVGNALDTPVLISSVSGPTNAELLERLEEVLEILPEGLSDEEIWQKWGAATTIKPFDEDAFLARVLEATKPQPAAFVGQASGVSGPPPAAGPDPRKYIASPRTSGRSDAVPPRALVDPVEAKTAPAKAAPSPKAAPVKKADSPKATPAKKAPSKKAPAKKAAARS